MNRRQFIKSTLGAAVALLAPFPAHTDNLDLDCIDELVGLLEKHRLEPMTDYLSGGVIKIYSGKQPSGPNGPAGNCIMEIRV